MFFALFENKEFKAAFFFFNNVLEPIPVKGQCEIREFSYKTLEAIKSFSKEVLGRPNDSALVFSSKDSNSTIGFKEEGKRLLIVRFESYKQDLDAKKIDELYEYIKNKWDKLIKYYKEEEIIDEKTKKNLLKILDSL